MSAGNSMESDAAAYRARIATAENQVRALQAQLAAIRDFSDNNPIIAEARRWYGRLNKSELLDSTTATRVGLLLCGLDAEIQRRVALQAQNAVLQAVANAASVFEQTCSTEEDIGEDEIDATFAFMDAVKVYRAAIAKVRTW
jgi:hypothetical protein